MIYFSYRALFEAGDEGGVVVSFPDVPEAITERDDEAEARTMAAEALGLALMTYAEMRRPFPEGSAVDGPDVVTIEPEVAAKVALISAFMASGISKSEFARRIDRDEKEARRLLNPLHASKIKPLREALAVFGKRLITGVADTGGRTAGLSHAA